MCLGDVTFSFFGHEFCHQKVMYGICSRWLDEVTWASAGQSKQHLLMLGRWLAAGYAGAIMHLD